MIDGESLRRHVVIDAIAFRGEGTQRPHDRNPPIIAQPQVAPVPHQAGEPREAERVKGDSDRPGTGGGQCPHLGFAEIDIGDDHSDKQGKERQAAGREVPDLLIDPVDSLQQRLAGNARAHGRQRGGGGVPALPEGPVEDDQQARADQQNGSRQNRGQHLHSNGILLCVWWRQNMPQVRPFFKDQTGAPLGLGLNRRGISSLLRSIWVDMPAIIIYLVPIQKW